MYEQQQARLKRVYAGYLAVTFLLLLPLKAQTVWPETDRTAERDAAVHLFHSADSLPIEFRADIQLTAIEAEKLNAGLNVETGLEQLFQDAPLANFKYPDRFVRVSFRESMERELSLALAFYNLDTLSIQIRVARQMLKVNRQKAEEELQEIQPQISVPSCESSLVPDLGKSYEQLRLLAEDLFSSQASNKSDFSNWILGQIHGVTSASQLAPIGTLLLSTKLTKGDLERLEVSYGSTLRGLKTTDRELAAVEDDPDSADHTLHEVLRELVERNQAAGIWSGTLLDDYRAFLLNSASQQRCAEAHTDWSRVIDAFNHLASQVYSGQNVPVLGLQDIKLSDSLPEHVRLHELPPTDDFGRLFGTIVQAKAKQQNADPSEHEATVRILESVYADFLEKIDAFNPAKSDCEDCAYFKKSKLLLIFFDQAPTPYYQSQLLNRLTNVMSTSPLQLNYRVLWLFQLQLLLNFSRQLSKEQSKQVDALRAEGNLLPMLPSSIGSQVLASMKQSADFVMYMYASADELFKPKFFAPYLK